MKPNISNLPTTVNLPSLRSTADLTFNGRMGERTIGVDMGGTTISFLDMFSPDEILSQKTIDLPATRDAIDKALIETIGGMASSDRREVSGVGLAVAGRINRASKSVLFSPQLPYKEEYPLGFLLEKSLGIPVTMDNDANAAAIGEKVFGAAQGMDDFISITLGTGIGSGIFVSGKILRGYGGAGGEAGHMVLDPSGPPCNCGNRGCMETLCSGLAIARMAKERLGMQKSAKELAQDAKSGDNGALEIYREAGRRLGDGLLSLVNIFNPEAIFFTGSLTGAPKCYLDEAFQRVREKSFGGSGRDIRLEISRFRDNIGVIGAAALPISS